MKYFLKILVQSMKEQRYVTQPVRRNDKGIKGFNGTGGFKGLKGTATFLFTACIALN